MIINPPTKIFVQPSALHGRGVFAKHFIHQGEIIEECPFLSLPIQPGESSPLFLDYRFNFPSGTENWEEQVIALGFGSLYNHSDSPNAYWYSDSSKRTFLFLAGKNIERGEEITVYYGDEAYWNDGRKKIIGENR